jgi:hypothetical protein
MNNTDKNSETYQSLWDVFNGSLILECTNKPFCTLKYQQYNHYRLINTKPSANTTKPAISITNNGEAAAIIATLVAKLPLLMYIICTPVNDHSIIIVI